MPLVGVEGGAAAHAQMHRPMCGGGGGVLASSETTRRGRRGHGRSAPDLYVVSSRKKKHQPYCECESSAHHPEKRNAGTGVELCFVLSGTEKARFVYYVT